MYRVYEFPIALRLYEYQDYQEKIEEMVKSQAVRKHKFQGIIIDRQFCSLRRYRI